MKPDLKRRFKGKRFLVLGEIGVDEYLIGNSHRISPEAPVPIVAVEETQTKLGLAGNVAHNIVALGGSVSVISVVGRDARSQDVMNQLKDNGIKTPLLLRDRSRPTPLKVRVITNKQHVVRIDFEKTDMLSHGLCSQVCKKVDAIMKKFDGLIIEDYAKGFWNHYTFPCIQIARKYGKPVFVDPNAQTPIALYAGATLLTPNLREAEALTGVGPSNHSGKLDYEHLEGVGRRILMATGAEHAVITCSENGVVSVSRGKRGLLHIPTFANEVRDVTGAGDTVISVIAMGYVSGFTLRECMEIANCAAGLVVSKLGASVVSPEELTEKLTELKQLGRLRQAA